MVVYAANKPVIWTTLALCDVPFVVVSVRSVWHHPENWFLFLLALPFLALAAFYSTAKLTISDQDELTYWLGPFRKWKVRLADVDTDSPKATQMTLTFKDRRTNQPVATVQTAQFRTRSLEDVVARMKALHEGESSR